MDSPVEYVTEDKVGKFFERLDELAKSSPTGVAKMRFRCQCGNLVGGGRKLKPGEFEARTNMAFGSCHRCLVKAGLVDSAPIANWVGEGR